MSSRGDRANRVSSPPDCEGWADVPTGEPALAGPPVGHRLTESEPPAASSRALLWSFAVVEEDELVVVDGLVAAAAVAVPAGERRLEEPDDRGEG